VKLTGLDHADIRVASLAAVEAFYDALLPALGLPRKTESHVGPDGEWYDVDVTHPRNAIEYHTKSEPGARGWFVGFIESDGTVATETRIAFGLDREDDLARIEDVVRAAGGRIVEWSIDPAYPALFFEDPVGTRLEICFRRPSVADGEAS
jgi:catechol 2,3-dioxygenase-like lactoylglutathione lyase family enzyme